MAVVTVSNVMRAIIPITEAAGAPFWLARQNAGGFLVILSYFIKVMSFL